jgi:hypothetical protein
MIAIIHEGKAERAEDNELLKLIIDELNYDYTKIRFFGFGSKENFFKEDMIGYVALKSDIDEEIITKVLFVVNAHFEKDNEKYNGYENTLQEMIKIRKKLDIYDISDLYISCDFNTKDGHLESLILSSIPQDEKECIETFLNCTKIKSQEIDKAVISQLYKKAFSKPPFNFQHQNFNILKQKLEKLFLQED